MEAVLFRPSRGQEGWLPRAAARRSGPTGMRQSRLLIASSAAQRLCRTSSFLLLANPAQLEPLAAVHSSLQSTGGCAQVTFGAPSSLAPNHRGEQRRSPAPSRAVERFGGHAPLPGQSPRCSPLGWRRSPAAGASPRGSSSAGPGLARSIKFDFKALGLPALRLPLAPLALPPLSISWLPGCP